MPDYDIYVLQEDDLTVSGGQQLDGLTQGDGSHLVGLTITLNTNAWFPVSISDPDDDNFQDNDGNQTLDDPATLNGITYAAGTPVEAEYALEITDGTDTWQVVAFNIANSSPGYATNEGLAFIGGPGGFPPVGVPLTVSANFEGPVFAAVDYATPICMAAGTRVATPLGLRPVEQISVGDLVYTRDDGMRMVHWHGHRRVACKAAFAPVHFDVGAIGNNRPLRLSQQHRVLVEGWRAELHFGASEVLVPAVHLVNDHSIRLIHDGHVTYHHLLLDKHCVLDTEGAWTESFYPGASALRSLAPGARAELFALFPELETGLPSIGALGYPAPTRHEATTLLRA